MCQLLSFFFAAITVDVFFARLTVEKSLHRVFVSVCQEGMKTIFCISQSIVDVILSPSLSLSSSSSPIDRCTMKQKEKSMDAIYCRSNAVDITSNMQQNHGSISTYRHRSILTVFFSFSWWLTPLFFFARWGRDHRGKIRLSRSRTARTNHREKRTSSPARWLLPVVESETDGLRRNWVRDSLQGISSLLRMRRNRFCHPWLCPTRRVEFIFLLFYKSTCRSHLSLDCIHQHRRCRWCNRQIHVHLYIVHPRWTCPMFRYIPSNFARREKRSLLDKIISKRIIKKPIIAHGHPQQPNHERVISSALVKFRYDAER